jgi:hypothetical protein
LPIIIDREQSVIAAYAVNVKEFAGEESARFDAGRIVGVRRGAGCHNFALGAAVLVKLANCG